jgi:hypothetical protein
MSREDALELAPQTPGSFTLPRSYYVNTATPRIIFAGSEEGTLPRTTGRWYLFPSDVVLRYPALTAEAPPVARARTLAR